ncbi:hypothetical protein CBS147323_3894 [Aspergillus niger]|nr:hypothetical protein CBS147323_3894 [Aspergillus niger]
MSFWSSYRSLSPKTRALFGIGVMAWASIGLWVSPQVENAMGMAPTKEEQEELDRKLAVRISRVEKDANLVNTQQRARMAGKLLFPEIKIDIGTMVSGSEQNPNGVRSATQDHLTYTDEHGGTI